MSARIGANDDDFAQIDTDSLWCSWMSRLLTFTCMLQLPFSPRRAMYGGDTSLRSRGMPYVQSVVQAVDNVHQLQVASH